MTLPVPEHHPLRVLFATLCHKNVVGVVRLPRPDIADYLGGLLCRFVHVDELRRVRDAMGRPLEDVGEMLLEADRRERTGYFQPAREVRRHIGDYTLFFLGMFPEYVHEHATTRLPGMYVEWSKEGKRSYRIVSEFRYGPYEREAAFYAALADHFEACAVGLNFVRNDLRQLADPRYAWIRTALG
jgi:hypothetical protein